MVKRKTGILTCGAIDLIVYDFDGVMTDNKVLVLEDGREGVVVSRADGLGVDLLRRSGLAQMIISTERNRVVAARARKLRLPVIQDIQNKARTLSEHLKRKKIDPARVLFVGNDVNDEAAMSLVGWPVCPGDAHPRIIKLSRLVLHTFGGGGVVRELADRLGLRA
jgi:YrbI family 3-deoxy-D-manno-octulosonate 8-phosphate phosphatase